MIAYRIVCLPAAVPLVEAVPLQGGWGGVVPVVGDPLGRVQWGVWESTFEPTTLAELLLIPGVTVTP